MEILTSEFICHRRQSTLTNREKHKESNHRSCDLWLMPLYEDCLKLVRTPLNVLLRGFYYLSLSMHLLPRINVMLVKFTVYL